MHRCFPQDESDQVYVAYHDQEWGQLNLDEDYLYQMMVLESFQSGLSWAIILHKRAAFRRAFADFDVRRVAAFDDHDRQRLLEDKAIVRNRRKIDAAINNARVLVQMHQRGQTLAGLLTKLIPQPIIHHPRTLAEIPSKDALSIRLAKQLQQAGFRFMGPVVTYSFLQAVGLINDHLEDCDYKY